MNNQNTPKHYQATIQPIELINAQNLNFNLGNVVKYVCRAGKKKGENVLSDLEKAQNYINYEIERVKKMNKQEVIEKIEKGKSNFNSWEDLVRNRALEDALTIVRKIDEPEKPEKPVVPQFVADWYEEHKDNFEIFLSGLCINFACNRERLNDKLASWYEQLENKPIETLVMMHKFGYEVENP